MQNFPPPINPKEEKKKITSFLSQTFKKQNIKRAVIGISGGIDSATSYFLLKEVLSPENIIAIHLPYETSPITIQPSKIISIKKAVDALTTTLKATDPIRKGNIMARVRMITLFDAAKQYNALVCGTENKSEHYLGYFTRFGDQASDIEPIQHLYKTQVYELAKYLGVPQEIIEQSPTAGLWEGQTDEKQFGFTYKEADAVLYLYFEKKLKLKEINRNYKNAEKIINWVKQNAFKHNVPYKIS